ncbi:MAG: chitobiase/beta-hexosaminidase C-terminal domain-containing protein [Bacteroidales bacterium]|nr:chitobiase/beta-hexosaminidase C-terminal domain-containing protein [Bacteroidales bacterium]
MSLSNYPSDLVRYKIYLGGVQYYCWDESLDVYQTSSSTGSGPLAPGTPTSSSSFWILYQRGTNISGDASYRDRVSPYSVDFKTISLTSSTSITTPFSLTGNFVPFGGYDNTIKHVVLAYSSSVLISATSTTLSTGAFALVCPDGTTIDLIEVRAIDNTLIASRTGSWSTTSVVGNVPDLPVVAAPVISPSTGNYYAPFSATITCSTPASSIYYTTDGTDKAKAFAIDFDPSVVVTEVFTFPVVNDVANIAALRAGLTDGTAYRLTGEAVLTFKSITRNAKYIQDATGAITIDDNTGKITTTYNLYDGITGITGTLSLNNLMLQFVPVIDPGAASSTGTL